MARKRVVFHGLEMDSEWPPYIEAAQRDLTYTIGGKVHARIRYGAEPDDWGADSRPCHDCAVIKGQLQVRGFHAEECPVCHGQPIACDCPYDRERKRGRELFSMPALITTPPCLPLMIAHTG
jgi:hypothetical protein